MSLFRSVLSWQVVVIRHLPIIRRSCYSNRNSIIAVSCSAADLRHEHRRRLYDNGSRGATGTSTTFRGRSSVLPTTILFSSSKSSSPSLSSSSVVLTSVTSTSTSVSIADQPRNFLFTDSSTVSSSKNGTTLFSHSLTDFASHVLIHEQPQQSSNAPNNTTTLTVSDVVEQVLKYRRQKFPQSLITDLSAMELIALGAVWHLPHSAPKNPSLGQKPIRLSCLNSNQPLTPGDYLRIHHHPRRFVQVYQYDWSKFITDDPTNTTSQPGVIVAQSTPEKGWMVIDKPEHVPVHGTVDNAVENAAECLRHALNLQQPMGKFSNSSGNTDLDVYVSTPQRLDQNTSGLLVIATNKVFANYFATLLRYKTQQRLLLERATNGTDTDPSNLSSSSSNHHDEAVHKVYRCLVCLMPPPPDMDINGDTAIATATTTNTWSVEQAVAKFRDYVSSGTLVRHYLEPSIRAPKRFVLQPPSPQPPNCTNEDGKSNTHQQDWAECLLQITNMCNVVYTLVGHEPGQQLARELWYDSSSPQENHSRKKPPLVQAAVELEIELLTGRTHQIRGQLSAMGYPLVGDAPYGGAIIALENNATAYSSTKDRLALQCCQLEFDDPDVVHHKHNGTVSMIRSKRRNVFRLERAWWTGLLERYRQQSSQLSTDQMTIPPTESPSSDDIQESKDQSSGTEDSARVARPELLPPRVSLSPGRNKYVLIRAIPSPESQADEEWFVKSATPHECGGPYHGNVAQDLREWIEAAGYQATVTGGGRIYYRPDELSAIVYGFSYGFGRGDHARAASLIRQAGIDAIVDDSPDLY